MRRHSVLQGHRSIMLLVILVCSAYDGLSWLPTANAFSFAHHHHEGRYQPSHSHQRHHRTQPQSSPGRKRQQGGRNSQTALALGDDWWNSLKGIFENLANGEFNNNDNSGGDVMAAGTSVIASIPVQSLKPGGLRLFLMFYLMGMQNTPDQGSWKAHQPDTPPPPMAPYGSDEKDDDTERSDEFDSPYVLEMFYKDASAMISIELLPNEVQIQRCGSLPSTAYLMHETVLVEGILDELACGRS
eukprot:CAMPEP_0113652728 /NCGR_PEP_ID=MMETSP0017_2-20120614/28178_1 /TAXON_ID=2856 /ORGANISM="Cylindrotheca closterium" /LENGTH=242 /DNA_ID=CAMNT_0000565629 /DNA_START=189 /DNA_END=917 /DNA_ORIENTATION=- /assembly_acc=CAM_ASM_000147